jgi:hypothetical protein
VSGQAPSGQSDSKLIQVLTCVDTVTFWSTFCTGVLYIYYLLSTIICYYLGLSGDERAVALEQMGSMSVDQKAAFLKTLAQMGAGGEIGCTR